MKDPTGPSASAPKSLKGYLLLGLAIVTCPCHLPILLVVLAGTGLAGVLSQYLGLAVLALTVIFAASLFLGLRALKREERGPDAEGGVMQREGRGTAREARK